METMDGLQSPTAWLRAHLGDHPLAPELRAWETEWRQWGQAVSDAVDRQGTPHLKMFDALGRRVDEIQYPPDYWRLLRTGYRAGSVWRVFEHGSIVPACLLGYVTAFFDPGLYCPYTVSLSTAVPVDKYADGAVRERFLEPLVRRDERVWQGATWMTEAKGGSDLGRAVETVAASDGNGRWRLRGEKHFCSNAGAELAVVAARPAGAPAGVRGLALFLVPRLREDGSLNVRIRRLKDKIATRSVPTGEVELEDSEGYLLGQPEQGVYLVLEVLNLSRVANSIGSVALAQRSLADAVAFARERQAFGRPIAAHPLLARQIRERVETVEHAWALAWLAVRLLDEVWRERPPYTPRYSLFRLVAHLAKHWTASVAVDTARWAVEVLAGAGTLAENRTERWLREAMILAIWEGTPHRQMLDGLETMERKGAHRLLLDELRPLANAAEVEAWRERLERFLALPADDREAGIEAVFVDLARFVAAVARQDRRVAPGVG